MKWVRIGKKPFIAHDIDRWGRELPTFIVYNEYSGYVGADKWKQIQEFENHSIAEEVASVCMQTGMTIQGNLEELMHMLPITKRLISYANAQLWQFNMYAKLGSEDMIRTYAVLGEPSLKNWTLVDDIRLAYLRWKCNNMNKRVLNADNLA